MKKKNTLLALNIGDWSGDGHNKNVSVLINCNKSASEIRQAYKDSCKLTGISFNHNEDYTGVLKGQYGSPFQICTEYEEYKVSNEAIEKLSSFGIEVLEEGYMNVNSFVDLWFDFVKLSLPTLQWEKFEVENINGFWNKELNCQFGYGLFE